MRSGKWCAYLLVDDGNAANELPVIDGAVGFDVGLEHYIVDSERQRAREPISSEASAQEAQERAKGAVKKKNRKQEQG